MNGVFHSDVFEIVNGPEDGTQFPVVRTPATLGRDATCVLQPRFDRSVELVHCRVTAVSGGYRIRAATGAPVHVDGKRAGLVRSRVVREGGIVRTGQTEFILRTAPEGLASRSLGMPSESDLGWVLRLAGRAHYRVFRGLFGLLRGLGTGLKVLFFVGLIIGIAALFQPSVLIYVRFAFTWVRYYFQLGYFQLFGG